MGLVSPSNGTKSDSTEALISVGSGASSMPAVNPSVSQAAPRVNAAHHAGDGLGVTLLIDRATRRPVVQVIDTDTKGMLDQWLAE